MKYFSTAAALATLLLAGSAFAQSSSPQMKMSAAKPAPAATAAVHATKGVVKSIDATTLVVTKVAGKGPDTSFVLSASTQREGAIAPGTTVDIRYRDEGKNKVATAVSLHEPKQPAAGKSKATK